MAQKFVHEPNLKTRVVRVNGFYTCAYSRHAGCYVYGYIESRLVLRYIVLV